MPFVTESTGEENANLYKRGVSEGSRGELLDASELLELLDVFGEDGVRSYLVGYLEGSTTLWRSKTSSTLRR